MPLGSKSDEEILTCICQHDESALDILVRRYYDRLGKFSFSLLNSRDLADVAVSNVFLNIWRRRESLVIRSTVRGYLFAAVGNQSLSMRKEKRLHPTVGIDHVHTRQVLDARSSDSDILYRELHDEIDALVSRLPRQRQLIFRMNRFEGLRYREIAEALGVSERTVQNQMVHATKQLGLELPKIRGTLARNSTANPFG